MNLALHHTTAHALLIKWSHNTRCLDETWESNLLERLVPKALALATIIDDHWRTVEVRGQTHYGLEALAEAGRIHPGTADELRELCCAIREAEDEYNRIMSLLDPSPTQEAEVTMQTIDDALSYLLSDGGNALDQHLLEAARSKRLRAYFIAKQPEALECYARLAKRHSKELAQLKLFPEQTVDHALEQARELRHRSSESVRSWHSRRMSGLNHVSARLTTALVQRMTEARLAIGYVFKHDEELLIRAGVKKPPRKRRKTSSRA